MHINIEFKAKTKMLLAIETKLSRLNARFVGEDHQIDTYFNVAVGRLKLREGNIENALIHYERQNIAGAKQSDVLLYQHEPAPSLKAILAKSLGIKVVVDKIRKIYFIDNVKIHLDTIEGLGTFVEVEAIDQQGTADVAKLQQQCDYYAQLFGVQKGDYIAVSYSDLLLGK